MVSDTFLRQREAEFKGAGKNILTIYQDGHFERRDVLFSASRLRSGQLLVSNLFAVDNSVQVERELYTGSKIHRSEICFYEDFGYCGASLHRISIPTTSRFA